MDEAISYWLGNSWNVLHSIEGGVREGILKNDLSFGQGQFGGKPTVWIDFDTF